MEYRIVDTESGKQVQIELPLEITAPNFSFTYFDDETKEERSSKPGRWFVDGSAQTPKNFRVTVREFNGVIAAINYARQIYVKYLKEEVRRVRGCDNDM